MTRILLIRHGQSLANIRNLFAGRFDAELTALGKEQATLTADFLYKNYKIDAVYTSPLKRAYATAKAFCDISGIGDPCVNDGLCEIGGGLWEGLPYGSLGEKHPLEYKIWMQNIGFSKCPGGEAVPELWNRIYDCITDIAEKNCGKTVAVFSHAMALRTLMCRLDGKTLADLQGTSYVSNASVSEYAYDNGKFEKISFSLDGHLGDLRTVLPSSV